MRCICAFDPEISRSVRRDKIIAVTLSVVIRLSAVMPFTSKEHVGMLHRYIQDITRLTHTINNHNRTEIFFLSEIFSRHSRNNWMRKDPLTGVKGMLNNNIFL